MNIELLRIRHRAATIDGQIRIDGRKVCDCAENAHHCLPAGTYRIVIMPCRLHARKMPVVSKSVSDSVGDSAIAIAKNPSPNAIANANANANSLCSSCHRGPYIGINTSMSRKCVQLCPGNGVYNRTDGSIIVGEYLVPGCLKHSRAAFANLYDRIRKNIERGRDITLTIR